MFYWNKKINSKNLFNVIFYNEFKHYFYQSMRKRPLVLLTNENRYIEININYYDNESRVIIARDVTQMIRLLHSRQTFFIEYQPRTTHAVNSITRLLRVTRSRKRSQCTGTKSHSRHASTKSADGKFTATTQYPR